MVSPHQAGDRRTNRGTPTGAYGFRNGENGFARGGGGVQNANDDGGASVGAGGTICGDCGAVAAGRCAQSGRSQLGRAPTGWYTTRSSSRGNPCAFNRDVSKVGSDNRAARLAAAEAAGTGGKVGLSAVGGQGVREVVARSLLPEGEEGRIRAMGSEQLLPSGAVRDSGAAGDLGARAGGAEVGVVLARARGSTRARGEQRNMGTMGFGKEGDGTRYRGPRTEKGGPGSIVHTGVPLPKSASLKEVVGE